MSDPRPARRRDSVGRAALLRTTVDVALEQGLGRVSARTVAEAAGVAHSLVRYHFGSIEALLTEALRFAIDEGIENAQAIGETSSLTEFTHRVAESVQHSRHVHAFLFEALLESRRRPELREPVARYHREYRNAVANQLRRLGVDDEAVIDIVLFALEGMVFQLITHPEQSQERAAEASRRLRVIVANETGAPLTTDEAQAAPPGEDAAS